jgi:hypothetical protein
VVLQVHSIASIFGGITASVNDYLKNISYNYCYSQIIAGYCPGMLSHGMGNDDVQTEAGKRGAAQLD